METVVPFLLLMLALVGWVALPFLPAIMELINPRDASPLIGVGSDAGELTWFADGFRRYAAGVGLITALDERYGPPLQPEQLDNTRLEPLTVFPLEDGTSVQVLRSVAEAKHLGTRVGKARTGHQPPEGLRDIIVVDVAARLPDHLLIEREVYARSKFIGGGNMHIRALLGAADVDIGANSTILRWVHAEGTLRVAPGTVLYGRVTSTSEIMLASGVRFERMAAPRIVIGEPGDEFVPPVTADLLGGEAWVPRASATVSRMSADTIRIRSDFIVPTGAIINSNLVVVGALVLEPGSQIRGDVKARRGIQLVGDNIVAGSLTAREDIHVGVRSRVSGPVIAEQLIHVHAHACVGTPLVRTTITAPRIVLQRGATLYGTVAARDAGTTE